MKTDKTLADYQAQYQLWDEFLQRWPLEKLRTMTLAEYNQAGSQDAFCYWLESKLDNMGSIWGGSAFKFGIYSRKDQSEKADGGGASYSDHYAWYTKYRANETEAFAKVRDELRYILDPADIYGDDYPAETFRVLKNNETRQFGEYRTPRLVL